MHLIFLGFKGCAGFRICIPLKKYKWNADVNAKIARNIQIGNSNAEKYPIKDKLPEFTPPHVINLYPISSSVKYASHGSPNDTQASPITLWYDIKVKFGKIILA